MKLHYVFIVILTLFISCSDDADNLTPPEASLLTGSLEVHAFLCELSGCEESVPLSDISIKIFDNEVDALNDENRLRASETNTDGKLFIPSLESQRYFIRADIPSYGTYISSQTIYEDAKAYHEIKCVEGFAYDNDDSASIKQRQISLSEPTVGQTSYYKFHIKHNYISYSVQEYTDNILRVSIIDKLDDNTYLIEEAIDSVWGSMFWGLYPEGKLVRSEWTFMDDSLHVTPAANEYFGSFVWNITGDYRVDSEQDGWSFSLVRPTADIIDMELDMMDFSQMGYGTRAAADYELFGTTYTELITDEVGYTSWDGPYKLRVYNLKYGPIRGLNYYGGMSFTTMGFDLVLD